MSLSEKTPCQNQGPGTMNPEYIGGYDQLRLTNDPSDPAYWITSGESQIYDAAYNAGEGGTITYTDLIKASKGAEDQNCAAKVTIDIQAKPVVFEYYPQHSLDAVFVLDVTSSMMSGGSHKMALAKRALVQSINLLWSQNKDTRVTIIPFGRDAMIPRAEGGLAYDYIGTLFSWRRSSTSGHIIGQLLGYRNNSGPITNDMQAYMAQIVPMAANVERSLYNFYNYYKISYYDIYEEDGTPKTDTVLAAYLQDVYAANPERYVGNFLTAVASGTPLTPEQLSYSMDDDGYENNTILQNMIWAIPYSEDTNTQAGLRAAKELLLTPGFTMSDDIHRRAVFLITDGQANRSIDEQYRDIYATPTSVEADFLPDTPGGLWKYYLTLFQQQPTLLAEINARSATNEELVLALQKPYEEAAAIKDPNEGNAMVFILGIDMNAQTPGPYTREDVISIMRTIASAPSYLELAYENEPVESIIEQLQKLVALAFSLPTGLKVTLMDTINTALFSYVPNTLTVSGIQDGLILKSKSAPDILDPSDPDYTVYIKPPLLPDVDDSNVSDGVITIDFGIMPFGFMSADTLSTVHVSYEIVSTGAAHGDHLHTNNDERTRVYFSEPSHDDAASSAVNYTGERNLELQTPIITCNSPVTIEKFVGSDPANIIYKSIGVKACHSAYYRIVVSNYTDSSITFPLLYDVSDVETIEEALNSDHKVTIAENFTVAANTKEEFIFEETVDCENKTTDFAVLTMENDAYLYDSAYVYATDNIVEVTVEYLDYCTKKMIHRPKYISVSKCEALSAYCYVKPIPGYRFVWASPEGFQSCSEKRRTIKLFYMPEDELEQLLKKSCKRCECGEGLCVKNTYF